MPATLLTLAALLLPLAGCTGGTLDLISLSYRDIDPPDARPTPLEFDRAYWWTEDDGRLHIALAGHQWNLIVPYWDRELKLVLDLERLPAGKARNYTLTSRDLRSVLRHGPLQGRLNCQSGILAVYREGEDRLRLSLRAQVGLQLAQLLGGWSQPSRFLLFGRCVAARDKAAGTSIREVVDAAWAEPPAASQPASAPAMPNPQGRGAARLSSYGQATPK